MPSGVPAELPSSTAPPPLVAQPLHHHPATPTPPTLPVRIPNEVMLKLLANPAAFMKVLPSYQQPNTSWTSLNVATPAPSTPPTVASSLHSLQPAPVPTSSTHPVGMPILPSSAVLQRTGRVTARVVGPVSAPVSQTNARLHQRCGGHSCHSRSGGPTADCVQEMQCVHMPNSSAIVPCAGHVTCSLQLSLWTSRLPVSSPFSRLYLLDHPSHRR